MGESTGDENSNLYIRGVNEGRSGEFLEASDLLKGVMNFDPEAVASWHGEQKTIPKRRF
jgi:hypothetical protein